MRLRCVLGLHDETRQRVRVLAGGTTQLWVNRTTCRLCDFQDNQIQMDDLDDGEDRRRVADRE